MDSVGASQIVAALEVIYSMTSSNDQRRQAQEFLEKIKLEEQSPYWGYQLALPDNNNEFVVRHFGLNLLQSAISNDLESYDSTKRLAIRHWIVECANKVTPQDPHYIKEKVAHLWVSVAKRCWGTHLLRTSPTPSSINTKDKVTEVALDNIQLTEDEKLDSWISMDKDLLNLWTLNEVTRELALVIFRTLFEDIYLLDDPIAASRQMILTSLGAEIVTSEAILNLKFVPTESVRQFRAESQGWLLRWAEFFEECLGILYNNQSSPETIAKSENFCLKILQTLKTSLHWTFPIALRDAKILELLCKAFMLPRTQIRILATDCLHVLFTRSFSNEDDFADIVGSIFKTEGIEMLSQVYQSTILDPDDIDEQKYTLLKKLVEMIVGLGEYLGSTSSSSAASPHQLPEDSNIEAYLKLVLSTLNHDSLIISGLSLQFWCSLLRSDKLFQATHVELLLPDLIEACSNRLLDYTDLSEEHTSKKFLEVDFDTTSESKVFVSNYKKFLEDIIRISICCDPEFGLNWLNNRLNQFFSSELGVKALSEKKLNYKNEGAESYIYGVSQFHIIECAVRGVSRWEIWYDGSDLETKKQYYVQLVSDLCEKLLNLHINDPKLLRKQIQTLVQFTPLLKTISQLMFKVLESVINSTTYEYPENATDKEREDIRDLRTSSGTELNRLAYLIPQELKNILDQLEEVIANILSSDKVSDHEAVAFKSFLLVVSQRSMIEDSEQRFAKIVDPELAAWSDPATEKGLLELPWFMERLGIVKIAEYFQSRRMTVDTNLLEADMDAAGRALRTDLKKHWESVFPIRATRILIQYSIEKLDHQSEQFQKLLALWKPRVQPIIPHVLQLLSQIQAYHNPANWTDIPTEVQVFVKFTTLERFWQQGVSMQTKDAFMEENVKAIHTLRDFADNVGHIVRYTREYAYLTISSISELEETLYEIPNIATLLWKALAGDSVGITLYSWRHMFTIVMRAVFKNCPLRYVEPFLSELLPQMLPEVDKLLSTRWEKVYLRGMQTDGSGNDEALTEEMMEEHMLRQLTGSVDRMLIDLVGQWTNNKLSDRQMECRSVIFNNKNILAPFLQLICNIIMYKDTRCSFNAILIVRNILPDILLKDDEVDKYLADNLMKALLQVLMDEFFADAQLEAGLALAYLYVTLRSKASYPVDVLQRLLPTLTSKAIVGFETILTSSTSLRQQRNTFQQLIATVRNLDESALKTARDKQLEHAVHRKKHESGINKDVMDDPYLENGALNGLFNENDT
ncbi:BA75_04670T0 [Komagataella pastoris]|uniref:BA75_04670T0 n=1 Tax=Komagataella pastoris TaxID=4922 RepID=A0A1B2JJG3_PICPA|nr:BA75_04670T0 [Komagataella pastoris]